MIARCAATLVGGFNFTDVEIVQDCIHGADGMILGNEVANAWREKKKIVLIVIFILYLCHRMSDICFFVFCTSNIQNLSYKNNSYSFDYQRNSYIFLTWL